MTPLLGTKNPSATVGDKSGGDRRAARAAAFQVFTKHETRDPRHGYCQARRVSQREFRGFHETRNTRHESRPLLWRGMGRLWRGMGGMGRPEPLSAHRPAPATAPFGFSRNTRPETRLLPGAPRKPARIPRFSRNTNHGFLVFPCPSGDSKESNPKPDQRVFHETRITNHGLYASLPTISHDFPAFPGPPQPPDQMPRRRPPQLSSPSGLPPRTIRSGESPMSHAEKGERSGLRCQASACGPGLDQRYNFARKQGRV